MLVTVIQQYNVAALPRKYSPEQALPNVKKFNPACILGFYKANHRQPLTQQNFPQKSPALLRDR